MNRDSRIYVAGHRGLVGSAILGRLRQEGYAHVVVREQSDLDLTVQADTDRFFRDEAPEYVFLAAARVGGILANSRFPAEFIRENLLIQTNVIDAAYRQGASKLLFLGSSCIYPKLAPQPIREESLLTGPLEPTNEAYAVAKIAGLTMCRAYRAQYGFNAIALMPTNLYGPGDQFRSPNSHVLPALLSRFHDARVAGDPEVVVWGTGTPRREFLHVHDLADAALFLMNGYDGGEIVNVGVGDDVSIAELAAIIAKAVGYTGQVRFDPGKPDGTPRKLLDISRLSGLGWRARIGLPEGIGATYRWFLDHDSPPAAPSR
jgi:GDP-L-fucose synthase